MAQDLQEPRPSLSIGITGHRPNKLPNAAIPRLERQLRDVMTTIEDAARVTNAGKPVHLISGFAEGVDQMAVATCPRNWTVEAILPFPKDEYLKDFEQSAAGNGRDVRGEFLASLARASSVTELPMPADNRDGGYLAAGRAMLRQIELLIAVWDGEKPKSGGTGQIVKEACEHGIPVVWLSSNAERPPVRIERFTDVGSPVASKTPWTSALSLPARPTPSGSA